MIPKNTLHKLIHKEVEQVPVPREISAQSALEQIQLLASYGAIHSNDPIRKKLKLLIELFRCCEDPTADALQAQLDVIDRFYEKPP